MEKVIRDGKVAVLYSPGYGAGWYTWNQDHPECLFDPKTVEWVEGGKVGPCPFVLGMDEHFCYLGEDTLAITWLPEGTAFEVEEYAGFETIKTIASLYLVA